MLSVLAVPRGSPAVFILLRTARKLRWSCTYERACVFICVCGCGTHVYSTRTRPGHGLRTPYRTGCTARVNTGACLLHFACVRAVRCSAWIVRAVVYLECVCVCVRQSACVARLVSFVQRFVCQRGQMGLVCPTPCAVRFGITGALHTCPCWYSCWYLFCTVLRMVNQTRVNVPSLPYPLRSSLGYHGRCTYSPVLVLVLIPLSYSASLGQPGQCITCPCSYSYWYPLCSASLGQHGQCTYLSAFILVLSVNRYIVCTVLISCTVLRLVRTGHVPTCPCSPLYWYLLCSWTARAFYLLALACILV